MDTKPELAIRSALHRRGCRFRKDHQIVVEGARARADIVFTRQRLAVFIDGCFWHRCPEHGNTPKTNSGYWKRKLDRNVARDTRVTGALTSSGWRVMRFWEHAPVDEVVAAIITELRRD